MKSDFNFNFVQRHENITSRQPDTTEKIMRRIFFFIFDYSDLNLILLGKTPILL